MNTQTQITTLAEERAQLWLQMLNLRFESQKCAKIRKGLKGAENALARKVAIMTINANAGKMKAINERLEVIDAEIASLEAQVNP